MFFPELSLLAPEKTKVCPWFIYMLLSELRELTGINLC